MQTWLRWIVMGQVLSHGQLVIESHVTEHDSEGSGPEHKVGLSGKTKDFHGSNRNNWERHDSGQDSDWKSKEYYLVLV